ncbi:MAG TPA: MBOAT family protein [Geminicoccus sp.]|jgi:D-alanyl-lipoteichoic acid acyltransferase DltB (MBOAT superfamily)|uniref:MBOAT family O-acyltransferase n=1 Tax=Geminicoccus sp. TaxID=2024832 RepID=UPI002E320D50|nr:MBOAT family protein [Geminicoccus sp.]HEX2525915.1 MBOAT family protein [Geminicoccus sp.]
MVFSSYPFLFGFLPIVLALCWSCRLLAPPQVAVVLLGAASIWFAGYWDWHYLPLLLGTILFNFIMSWVIHSQKTDQARRLALFVGVAGDLLCLGYFKYSMFVVGNLEELLDSEFGWPIVILPIGISFYIFTQIAFLVDIWRDRSRPYGLIEYILFVTIFPHLIAGPIIHHKEMIPQFRRDSFARFDLANVNTGIAYFVFGLAKKVLIADNIAPVADAVFQAADRGDPISTLEAWFGTLAYALQLFFDFSGYADMAIGLGFMLGVVFPQNFDRPYRATSIGDFWRRWHITLSRFLRDYLYIPLGGNRHGFPRELLALFVTMLLGGIWHGAGWTFVIWGVMHGSYLVIQRLWQRMRGGKPPRDEKPRLGLGWLITMLAVLVAWVPFRATTLDGTFGIWQAMILQGPMAPDAWRWVLRPIAGTLEQVGVTFGGPGYVRLRLWGSAGPIIVLALGLALFLPRSDVLAESLFGLRRLDGAGMIQVGWRAVALGVAFFASVIYLGYHTTFLYFQF